MSDDYESDLFEAYATITPQLGGNSSLVATVGYSWQEQVWQNNSITLRDFPNDAIDWSNNYGIAGAFQLGGASRIGGGSWLSPEDRIIAFFGRVNYTWDNAIFLNASVRHEGSTRLGEENKWGTFPAVGLGVDLNNYLELPNVNLLKLRVGYGVTGALPGGNGYSREIYGYTGNSSETGWATTFDGGRAPNPDLKWEEKAEINFGLEFATDRLSATVDVYSRNNTDFIIPFTIEASEHPSGTKFSNAGKIQTNGVELAANYDFIQNDKLNYNSGIVLSSYKSTLKEYLNPIELRGSLGAPGQNDTEVVLVQEGEQIGQIVGSVWSGEVDADGSQIFEDVDGDGTIETDQTKENFTDGDLAVLGNGIPDFELGWTNQLTVGNWNVNAFFRGQFGHSLVNNYRVFFEPRVGSQTGYNFVNTELADENIKTAKFSSHYVEKADFFRLDNLSVSYSFNLGENLSKYLKSLTANVAGQNLFTITSYTGNDPEASLQDVGNADNGSDPGTNADPLTPGIDRRNNYFTQRTFSLGLVAKF
ncbi:TonB-dependent receptor domain-containing protein [Maribacter sp. HTCC2170]|uniref:TonB-dependent receptor domain-containing protein n=1 Tax=Maribacter sp. (strain HTCC2170 / KCCM 42371) TaxID=313603 RepID=UPI00006AE5F0|nr:TonB-dependent receptor [Maribacter sp. HTCC2170]EAR00463.1 putative outer membrane protein, probably involved in nutrient binding [Maribacter sp. HTCC2170]